MKRGCVIWDKKSGMEPVGLRKCGKMECETECVKHGCVIWDKKPGMERASVEM